MAKGLDCGTSYYITATEDSIKKQRNQTIHKIDEKISLEDLALLQEIYQQILVETNNQVS